MQATGRFVDNRNAPVHSNDNLPSRLRFIQISPARGELFPAGFSTPRVVPIFSSWICHLLKLYRA